MDPLPKHPRTESRLELHDLLKQILNSGQVYLQAPSDVKMVYPAIVYTRDDQYATFADNTPYRRKDRWLITVIDKNPVSAIAQRLEDTTNAVFVRSYETLGLNHILYNLHY